LEQIKKRAKKAKTSSAEVLNELIISLIQDKKGNNILSLDLRHIPEAIADYFIICHALSTTQVRAITDHIDEEVKKQVGLKPYHLEGRANAEWCLIDFGDVIVHVFQQEKREFYQLEDLWSDAMIKHYD
jgi:ribosome-associated protein